MNVKKSLGNRIRGWFPQEPKLPKAAAKIDFRINKQIAVPNMERGTLRTAKFSGIFAALWAIVSTFTIVQNVTEFHIPLTSQLGWIVAGMIFGLILSTVVTLRQLKQIKKNHKYEVNSGDLELLVIPLLLFFVSGLLFGSFFYSFQSWMQGSASAVWLISMFEVITLSFAVRCVLFSAFEKKEKAFIVGYWFQSGIYEVPWLNANSSMNFSENNSAFREPTKV